MKPPKKTVKVPWFLHTLKQAKRLVAILVGFTILILGLAMLVLPGPGIVVIIAGLAILATEFVWARRLLHTMKQKTKEAGNYILGKNNSNKKSG